MAEESDVIAQAFASEFAHLRRLSHENVVRLLATVKMEKKDAPPAYITEHCERGGLDLVVKRAKSAKSKDTANGADQLTVVRKWSLLHDVAAGLVYLHGLSPPVVHRDLKPANIFVNRSWQAKLGDFGMARTQKHSSGISTVHGGAGTFNYKAPEQSGDGEIGVQADVYAFGGVMIETLTGYCFSYRDEHVVFRCLPLGRSQRSTSGQSFVRRQKAAATT